MKEHYNLQAKLYNGEMLSLAFSDGVHIMHLAGVAELHRFCAKLGIKRCWYHPTRRFPHYDIPKRRRKDFFERHPEVNKVSPRQLVAMYVRLR